MLGHQSFVRGVVFFRAERHFMQTLIMHALSDEMRNR